MEHQPLVSAGGIVATDSNFLHTFWSCEKLKKYWDDIFSALIDIFHIYIPKEPLYALLGVAPQGFERRDDMYLLQILLVAAVKELTVNWLKPTVPTFQSWKDRVWELYRMEKITHNLRTRKRNS